MKCVCVTVKSGSCVYLVLVYDEADALLQRYRHLLQVLRSLGLTRQRFR